MAFTKSQIILIGIGTLLLLSIILIFIGVIPGLRSTEAPDITGEVVIWGTLNDETAIAETIIANYGLVHPGVSITYVRKNAATYENELVNALAAGRGPDAYFIKNTWVANHADRLLPLTAEQYPASNLDMTFPSVVAQDFSLSSSTVYGFPLFIDTLALFYNQNLLDNAGIAAPPKTWEELEAMIPRLTSVDSSQKIHRSAIALGGSLKSVSHATDILTLMFMQDGVAMNRENTWSADFAGGGGQTLARYLRFANPADDLYTWNDSLGSDVDAFARGELAMMLGYQDDAARIREKNPFLRFTVAPMLQKSGAQLDTNYASYWGLTVTAAGKNPGIAWDVIGTATLNPEIAAGYANATGLTPALRTLIGAAIENPTSEMLARQALTARNWRQMAGSEVDVIFSDMIESVLTGRRSQSEALRTAQETIDTYLGETN